MSRSTSARSTTKKAALSRNLSSSFESRTSMAAASASSISLREGSGDLSFWSLWRTTWMRTCLAARVGEPVAALVGVGRVLVLLQVAVPTGAASLYSAWRA
jgi:hypothetical protein